MSRSPLGLLCLFALAACGDQRAHAGDLPAESIGRDGRLAEVSRRVILGKDEIRVVDIDQISQHPTNPALLLVVDGVQDRAMLIDTEKRIVIARSNPSDLPRVVDAEFLGPDSMLLSDIEMGLQVAGDDFTIARSIPMRQQLFAMELHVGQEGVLVESTDTHNTELSLFHYDLDGELLWSGGGFAPDRVAPFWGEFFQIRAAQLDGRLFVASSMEYPLRVLQGGEEVEFGSPPPGYRQARRPVRFEFSSAERGTYEDFARSFTTISSIWATNSLLYVEHRDLDPHISSHRAASYQVDVYDVRSLTKLGEALPLPGPILRAFDGRIETLAGWPPAQDWTLASYEFHEGGGD